MNSGNIPRPEGVLGLDETVDALESLGDERPKDDRMLWLLEHVLLPCLVLGVIGLFVLLPLNLLGVVGHHGCAH